MVPLDLAITPMRVLQDPLLGPECSAMYEEGDVDDRFLMILFLMLERLRKKSTWKPYVYCALKWSILKIVVCFSSVSNIYIYIDDANN